MMLPWCSLVAGWVWWARITR